MCFNVHVIFCLLELVLFEHTPLELCAEALLQIRGKV